MTEQTPEEWAESIGNSGAGALKMELVRVLNEHLEPIRERRLEFAKDPDLLSAVLEQGTARAREVASQTLDEVREAMNMRYGTDTFAG